MTGITEKCNLDRSPHVNQAILLLAFADWMKGRPEKIIRLCTEDSALAQILGTWADSRGLACVREKGPARPAAPAGLRNATFRTFRPLRALVFLAKRIWQRRSLRGLGLREWRSSRATQTFVTYLFHQPKGKMPKDFLKSPYWGELPKFLKKEGIPSNWLHLYVESPHLPQAGDAAGLLGSFRRYGPATQNHATLDTFMSGSVVLRTLGDWLRLQRMTLGKSWGGSFPKNEGFDFWPLFCEEWRESLAGPPAMTNLLHLNLFESAWKELPRQRLGIYLQENLGWEMAMLFAWRQNGHGRIIGFPHAAIRFWDLRYFQDAKDLTDATPNGRPHPDRVAVHGPHARKSLQDGGLSARQLVGVEALRHPPRASKPRHHRRSSGPRILILGDYAESHTRNQMELLHEIAGCIPPNAVLVARPHPACPIRPQDYPNLSFSISSQTLDRLLAWADLVYASPTTSAALDALSCGVPVVIPIGEHGLNLSPLKGLCEKSFVSGPEQLAQAFATIAARKNRPFRPPQLFRLDPRLPRWMKLIQQHSSAKRASEH